MSLYPDIGLVRANFPQFRMNWRDKANRRKFFEKLAKDKKFDPKVAENWYNVNFLDVKSRRVCIWPCYFYARLYMYERDYVSNYIIHLLVIF